MEGTCNKEFPLRAYAMRYEWSDWQNAFFEDFDFTCNNGFLHGIQSYHSSGDRRYKFQCVYFNNIRPYGCDASGYTDLGETWNKHIPVDKYLAGINSKYDRYVG